ncbi:MAG: hypothetical protein KBC30_10165 [Planctomycetes bacterium]|nr:hypothetical protein [Planctomycetota bacterium]
MKDWVKNIIQVSSSFVTEVLDGSLSEGILKATGKQIKEYFSSADSMKNNYKTAIQRSTSSLEIALKGTRAYYPTREKEFYKKHFSKFEQNIFLPFAQEMVENGHIQCEEELRDICIKECEELKKIMPKIFHLDDITDSDMSSLLHSNESTSQASELMLQEIANKSNSQYLLQLLQRDNVLFSGVVFHFHCIIQANPEFGTYLQNIQVSQLQITLNELQITPQPDSDTLAKIERLEQYIQALSNYDEQMGAIGRKLDDIYEKTLQTYEVLERLEKQMKSSFNAMEDRLNAITQMIQEGFQNLATIPAKPETTTSIATPAIPESPAFPEAPSLSISSLLTLGTVPDVSKTQPFQVIQFQKQDESVAAITSQKPAVQQVTPQTTGIPKTSAKPAVQQVTSQTTGTLQTSAKPAVQQVTPQTTGIPQTNAKTYLKQDANNMLSAFGISTSTSTQPKDTTKDYTQNKFNIFPNANVFNIPAPQPSSQQPTPPTTPSSSQQTSLNDLAQMYSLFLLASEESMLKTTPDNNNIPKSTLNNTIFSKNTINSEKNTKNNIDNNTKNMIQNNPLFMQPTQNKEVSTQEKQSEKNTTKRFVRADTLPPLFS